MCLDGIPGEHVIKNIAIAFAFKAVLCNGLQIDRNCLPKVAADETFAFPTSPLTRSVQIFLPTWKLGTCKLSAIRECRYN